MRILIIGAGNTGRRLAGRLCEERHDVILVDIDEDVLAEAESHLDILTICGRGSSPDVLAEAQVNKADLMVAVTNDDEVNILSGLFAKAAGVAHVVVRVTDQAYTRAIREYNLQNMGIDLAVSQKETAAAELFRMLTMPGSREVVDLLDGRMVAVGINLHSDSPLIRTPLHATENTELIKRVRFLALQRGHEVLIPDGSTQFMIGDELYFAAQPEHVLEILDWVYPDRPDFNKVIIAGGGELGLNLAQKLEGTSIDVVLIESHAGRAEICSEKLNHTLVLHGDSLDMETLENAGISGKCAYVASTGQDENNILGCLVAERQGASFTIAQVSKPEYVPIITSSSLLDRAVSPHTAMINAILRFLRGRNIQSAASLSHLPGELLEVILPEKNKWCGKHVSEVKTPRGSIIAAVKRADNTFVATGETVLEPEDRLVMFALKQSVHKIESFFKS